MKSPQLQNLSHDNENAVPARNAAPHPRRRHSAEHNLRVRLHRGEGDVLTITLEEEIRLHRIIGGIVHILTKTARKKTDGLAIQDLKMKPSACPQQHQSCTAKRPK